MADLPITSDEGATPIVINDPTTTANVANVKAASTASVVGDNSLVVALSPNSPVPTGTNKIGITGVAQGSTTSGQNGNLEQGAVTTSAPTYVTGQTSPLSLDTSGNLRVTFASGEVSVNLNQIDGNAAVTAATGVLKVGIVGNAGAAIDAASTQNVSTPANGIAILGEFNTTPTTITSGNSSPLQLTSAARLIVDGSQVTQPVSGTVTANQGTANTLANAWSEKITDGTNGPVAVKAASTAALATDPALVVSLSPNSPTPLQPDRTGSGTITALNGAITFSTQGCSGVVFNITGTWVATLQAEATVDGTNWFTVGAYIPSSNSTVGGIFANTQAYVGCGGFAQVRLIATAYTSGTANVAYDASAGDGTLLQEIASNTAASSSDYISTGNITAINGNVEVSGQGVYTVSASIIGTWVATLVAQGQLADGNWVQIPMYLVNNTLPYQPSFAVTTNGVYLMTCGAYTNIRILASAFTSGVIDISLDGSLAQQTIFAAQLGTWNFGVTQGSTTSGETGPLVQGAVTTNPPTYTTAQTNPLSLNVGGGLRTEKMLSTRQYYGVSTQAFTPPATPTDISTIIGSATTTIRVTRIEISTTQTTAGINTWFVIKRSTANTGGTSATPTIVPLDSNNAAATSIVRSYTANPTALGAAVGTMRATRILSDATGTTAQTVYTFDFTNGGISSGIVLRGVAQTLALNFGGAALPAGLSVSVNFEWSEE